MGYMIASNRTIELCILILILILIYTDINTRSEGERINLTNVHHFCHMFSCLLIILSFGQPLLTRKIFFVNQRPLILSRERLPENLHYIVRYVPRMFVPMCSNECISGGQIKLTLAL